MVEPLEVMLKHDQTKKKTVLIKLEMAPSTFVMYHVDKRHDKKKDDDGIENYHVKERTILYEFDRDTSELKVVGKYSGHFRSKDFNWNERRLEEFRSRDEIKKLSRAEKKKRKVRLMGIQEHLDVYLLAKRVIRELKERYQKLTLTKEKSQYTFFIKTLKKAID